MLLGLLGFLPGTRKRVTILLRAFVGQPEETYVSVEAVRIRGGAYRILTTNAAPERAPWEFWPGETVACTERCMQDGLKALVATQRHDHAA